MVCSIVYCGALPQWTLCKRHFANKNIFQMYRFIMPLRRLSAILLSQSVAASVH